jgi:hypothetical protein
MRVLHAQKSSPEHPRAWRHLVVPEPPDFPALTFQISVAGLVAKAFCVLRAVGLDDQLSANAKKVDDVGTDWDLPAKLESAEAAIAQKTPQAKRSQMISPERLAPERAFGSQ